LLFWAATAAAFHKPEEFLKGKPISVTGLIKLYKGKPEIIVAQESQIYVK
jgi:DNA/RNA endonuclease YhcR with UshA esterase domain